MATCFLYPRVSSLKQRKEGLSIEHQIDKMTAYADRENLDIAGIFLEVQTAAKVGRTQFNLMLEEMKKPGAPKIVLVDCTDRLTRNDEDEILARQMSREYSVEFRLISTGSVWHKDNTAEEELFQGFEVKFAKYYIQLLRRKVKGGQFQKVKAGGWSWPAPHGYQNVEGKLIVDEHEKHFVKKAFELFSAGDVSVRDLSSRLFNEGYFYRPSQPKMSKSQIHRLLSNRLYIGELEYHGEIYPGIHEPIIARGLFDIVQGVLTGKGHQKSSKDFIYQGLLTCAACGSRMCGELKKGKYIYYRCWKAAERLCPKKYINEIQIDKSVNNYFLSLCFPENYKQKLNESLKHFHKKKQIIDRTEIEHLKTEEILLLQRQDKAYEDYQEGIIDEKQYKRVKQKYEDQSAVLVQRLAGFSTSTLNMQDLIDIYFELPDLIRTRWVSGSALKKKTLLNILTSNLIVKDGKTDVKLKEPFGYLLSAMKYNKWRSQGDELITLISSSGPALVALYNALAA